MHREGWIFDIEVLVLAEWANIPVVEVPTELREAVGNKLNGHMGRSRMARGAGSNRVVLGHWDI